MHGQNHIKIDISFFFLVTTLLNQWWIPSLRLVVSDCTTIFITCIAPVQLVFANLLIDCLVLFRNTSLAI